MNKNVFQLANELLSVQAKVGRDITESYRNRVATSPAVQIKPKDKETRE